MLTTYKNKFAIDEVSPEAVSAASTPQLIERIFTDKCGRQFKMIFLVAVVDGEIKGKLVSVQPLSQSTLKLKGNSVTSDIICLPIVCSDKKGDTIYASSFTPVVSPYVSLEFLMTSQPTRAPSFR